MVAITALYPVVTMLLVRQLPKGSRVFIQHWHAGLSDTERRTWIAEGRTLERDPNVTLTVFGDSASICRAPVRTTRTQRTDDVPTGHVSPRAVGLSPGRPLDMPTARQ
ncbi:hypothetical protein ACWD0Z_10690 [Streptomyces sp. NPDC003007]